MRSSIPALIRVPAALALLAALMLLDGAPEARSTSPAAQVAAGGEVTCMVTTADQPFCWGSQAYGALGDGVGPSGGDANVKTPIGLAAVAAIDTSGTHTCAVLLNGDVSCWGFASSGALGGGGSGGECIQPEGVCWKTMAGLIPSIPIPALPAFNSIATGAVHTCVLLQDASLMCWGANDAGQLGTASGDTCGSVVFEEFYDCSLTPLAVTLPDDALMVTAGRAHTCVLLASDEVRCWGANEHGQLGNGTTSDSQTPVAVSGLPAGLAGVDAGLDNTCAWTGDGEGWCWGANDFGQLTTGTTGGFSAAPVVVAQAPGIPNDEIRRVYASRTICALKDDDSVWCWGNNAFGQAGDGTQNDALYPVQVPGLAASGVAVGVAHTCAVRTDGVAVCWGINSSGQIGTEPVGAVVFFLSPSVIDPDSDGDGCSDDEELATGPGSEMFGGERSPKNPWDFYDVANSDRQITLVDDIFAVAYGFGGTPGNGNYAAYLDRSAAPPGSDPWDMGPPDGQIDLVTDIFGVAFQFGHDCSGF